MGIKDYLFSREKKSGEEAYSPNRLEKFGAAITDAALGFQGKEGYALNKLLELQNQGMQAQADSAYKQQALGIEQGKLDAELATARSSHDVAFSQTLNDLLKKKGKDLDRSLFKNGEALYQQGKRLGLYTEFPDSKTFVDSYLKPKYNEFKLVDDAAKKENWDKLSGFFQPIEKAFSQPQGGAGLQAFPGMGMVGTGAGAAINAKSRLQEFLKQLGM